MYDPETDSWSSRAPMPTARALLSTSMVDGKLYAIGGPFPGRAGVSIVEAYDPVTDAWEKKRGVPTGRYGLSTSTVNGTIYAIGGASGFESFSVVEEYDPVTDTWTTRSNMPAIEGPGDGPRWAVAASTVNGRIYAIGGASEVPVPHTGSGRVQEYTAVGTLD